ncbi:prephenate dehydrogenase [Eubacterium xylanophilum]|uniref:prephenate dehydrogenase n=1 Tax=Eubacterium xylanophilum TaxID=39497 RepID=UPI0004B64D13|nr:prephenate dehydrogenase/arogenate dehydrogenase family protein [Eubacterium xylanophilum]
MIIENKKIGFIGLGLIGGCVARCIKKASPSTEIIAYNNRYPDVKPGLKQALEDGVISRLEKSIEDGFGDCDIIFLCAPVRINVEYLAKLKNIIKPDCIITDVGSVKSNIHAAVTELGMEENFIGGHPMAGTEKTGYENSSVDILTGAFYLLTPTGKTPEFFIDTMKEIIDCCKCRAFVLEPGDHDMAAAAISHVPHVLSYALVNTVQDNDNEQQYMKQFAAGGFRDMTRIAASSPEMWQSIVLSNKDCIIEFMNSYIGQLEAFKKMLDEDDEKAIYDFFKKSKEYRDTF